MLIALAQINSVLGDFSFNRKKIVDWTVRARDQGAELVVFPELSLMGYLPNDLLERKSIVEEQLKELKLLAKEIPKDVAVVIGAVTLSPNRIGKRYFNSAVLIGRGQKAKFFHKQLLPTYDVFDEARHIEHGEMKNNFFIFKGKKILVTICEDIWGWDLPEHPTNYLANPLVSLKKKKPDLILNLSASPFTKEKRKNRYAVIRKTAQLFRAPLVYVNMVGGQDEIVFDGGSLAVDKTGRTIAQSTHFAEDLNFMDLSKLTGGRRKIEKQSIEQIRQALVLGLRDFIAKTGLHAVHLGLSGGIDSAVVACLAVDALGPNHVSGVVMPGPFNARESKDLSRALAKNLGIRCLEMPISTAYEVSLETIHRSLGEFEFGLVNENLQARLRGLLLMGLANRENSLLLSTGNKCEFATGYSTLYGDMCGGLAPIGDLLKSEIYSLAALYNLQHELIPKGIIERPPTAELRPNQKDQDSLPAYDVLDAAIVHIVEKMKPARNETEKWLLKKLAQSEFKRWQAPPILKVSEHAFGRGRRMPLANRAWF